MQTRALISFLSALAIMTAPAVAVLGSEDTLTGPKSVFGTRSIASSDEWVDDQALQSFLEERLGGFIDKELVLEGTSLAERLDFLAQNDLYRLIENPLDDKQVLKAKIEQLFSENLKAIVDGDKENFLEEVRLAVKRHITAVLLKGDKTPEEALKMTFEDIASTVNKITETSIKGQTSNSKVIIEKIKALFTDVKIDFTNEIILLAGGFKNYNNYPQNFLDASIGKLLASLLDESTNTDRATERFRALTTAYVNIESLDSTLLITSVKNHFLDNSSNKINLAQRTKLLVEVYQLVLKSLIQQEKTQLAKDLFKNSFILQFFRPSVSDPKPSTCYCNFLQLAYEKNGLSFATKQSSPRDQKSLTIAASDFLYSLASCKDNTIALADLETAIEHLEDLISLEESVRQTTDIHPPFLKIKEIDVASNFDMLNALYNLYLGLRVDRGFTEANAANLEAELDDYLDLLISDSSIATETFRNAMKKFYVMIKVMIAMPGMYPADHIIRFKSQEAEVYDNFAVQIRNTDIADLKKFVASLFSVIFNENLEYHTEESKLLFINREVTFEQVNQFAKSHETQ